MELKLRYWVYIYALDDDDLVNKKDTFFEKLTEIEATREVIILGDLNGRAGKQKRSSVIGHCADGTKIIELCDKTYLKILNAHYNIKMNTNTHEERKLDKENLCIIDYIISTQASNIKVHDITIVHNTLDGNLEGTTFNNLEERYEVAGSMKPKHAKGKLYIGRM
ncbi:hypothetical protein FQA39_LY00573 [Lamprigera yunnana]|nr:hypothetical protein FQA39_LY00573 [Lamprigera yunnana]